MAEEREWTLKDIERAAQLRDPQLADMVVAFLEQGDPPPGQPEIPPERDDLGPGVEPPDIPEDTDGWNIQRLTRALSTQSLAGKTATERKIARREAWSATLAAPHPAPRLLLCQLLLNLYEANDEPARAALLRIMGEAPIKWGLWGAFKRIYKMAETRHDVGMLGVLCCRLDMLRPASDGGGEISPGTLIYMRRRAWRYLRQLGQAVPEAYPTLAAQVLKNYPKDASFYGTWIASQIWAHGNLKKARKAGISSPPSDVKKRAFDEAWKLTAEPLLRLLEDCANDQVAAFAIRGLETDFKQILRGVDPRWLDRLGRKPLAAVHDFVVKLLGDSAEFHQSRLKELGLHEMVLGLLRSESSSARKYAVDYARAHAPDMPVVDLVALLRVQARDVREFAANRLKERKAQELGLDVLVDLVGAGDTAEWASTTIQATFKPQDLSQEHFIRLASGTPAQRKFAKEFYSAAKLKTPARFITALLDDPRCDWSASNEARRNLSANYTSSEIGVEWLKKALLESSSSSFVQSFLRSDAMRKEDLDVEWLKGLTMRPQFRPLALEILGNPQRVQAHQIGLPWLLAMARQPDETLHKFAHHYLLQHVTPEDFAREVGSSDVTRGIERLWSLLSGAHEGEPVRQFAATYLKVHHPEMGPTLREAKDLGIKPRLPRETYSLDRLRPLFTDARPDVRRLACAVARFDLVRWAEVSLLYALADSPHREPRALAAEILLNVGEPNQDQARVPPADWLTPSAVFALAESPYQGTREVALTLIRRHYDKLGSPRRLCWLMEGSDRDVRLFAVRLLWEKHRPREISSSFKPRKGERPVVLDAGAKESTQALRSFLRSSLYGLPPGRMERRELNDVEALPDRNLPASISKRRLVEVMRDLAVQDAAFADVVLPILEEFVASEAKGEWQACVEALAWIRRAHPQISTALPAPLPMARPKVLHAKDAGC